MPRSSLTSCSITATPVTSPVGSRTGEAVASTPSSLPVAREMRIERRPRFTRLPVERHCCTGSAIARRSCSSTKPIIAPNAAADRLLAAHAGQSLRGLVQVVDHPVRVGRDDALAEGVERELGARGRRACSFTVPVRQHFLDGEQDPSAPARLDGRAGEFEARDLAVAIREFDFGERRLRTAGEGALDRERGERRVFARDQVRESLALELARRHADQGGKRLVGGLDALAVQQGRLAQRRHHRARGIVAGPAKPLRKRLAPQAQECPPLPPYEYRKCSSDHRQHQGGDRLDRHQASHPLVEHAVRGTVNFVTLRGLEEHSPRL